MGKGRTGTCLVLTVLSAILGAVWTGITAGMIFAIYGRGRLSEGTKDMIVMSLGTEFGGATEIMKNGGIFSHGFTYGAHPVGTAVALETLKIFAEQKNRRQKQFVKVIAINIIQ